MRKLTKAFTVVRDHYRSLTPLEFARFVRGALFMDENILIYGKGLDRAIERSDRPKDAGGIVKGTPADLEESRRQLGAGPVPWELQCDRYDGVRDFFVYKERGAIGHISWLYYPQDPNRILRLGEGECEVKFCLTTPDMRGRGLYPLALQAIQRHLADGGYRRCFICVKEDNLPSIRGIERAGFRRLGAVRIRKVLGVQVTAPRRTADLGAIDR